MSLRLIVIRHAKSAWGDLSLPDRERPLNGRGQRDAPKLGAWLKENGYLPDQALVSGALRTRMTWAGIADQLDSPPEPDVRDALYHSSADTLLSVVQVVTGATCLAMVAHNPGIGMFAHSIASMPPEHSRFADYPTGATLVVDFDCAAWSDVTWRAGQVIDFVTPRDL
ncbi:MAG: histidine phosphatase family protein [Pseudomonadota bacterium]